MKHKIKRATKLGPYHDYLRARHEAASPERVPSTVLLREIAARGYTGGLSQLRAFLRTLRPAAPSELPVRFEPVVGEQLQVDWVEFRKGERPLHAFCDTLGYSRASYVEFVSDMKVETLIGCQCRHEPAA